MSTTNDKKSNELTVDPTFLASLTRSEVDSKPAQSRQDALAELQYEEALRLRDLRLAAEHDKQFARNAKREEIRAQIALKDFAQASCPHRKPFPSQGSAFAGQRDHRGVTHFICQYCQIEYTGTALPPEFRISSDLIGGPNL